MRISLHKLYATFHNYKSRQGVFIWEQYFWSGELTSGLNRFHNSRNICLILTTAFPILRCKLFASDVARGLGRDQEAHSKTMQEVEQVLLQQSIWSLTNSSLCPQGPQRTLKESPCRFRQTVPGFAEELVITNCLSNHFYILFVCVCHRNISLSKRILCLYL